MVQRDSFASGKTKGRYTLAVFTGREHGPVNTGVILDTRPVKTTSLTIAPADLDGPCLTSWVSKNDTRVYGPCSWPENTACEHG